MLDANRNFLAALGYSLEEIHGRHHAMFVGKAAADSADYKAFWERLRRGEFQTGQFKRYAKDGSEVWIEASYNPVLDGKGRVYKIVKFASDVTARTREHAEMKGQVEAISKVSAVIAFDLDGNILDANENFLSTVGYGLDEIRGKHHRMFVDAAYARSPEYREFWAGLRRGEFQAGQFRRFGKGGKEVWIEASYNPILTPDGVPYKVVKFATDISAQMQLLANLRKMIDENFSRWRARCRSPTSAPKRWRGGRQDIRKRPDAGLQRRGAGLVHRRDLAEHVALARCHRKRGSHAREAEAATGKLGGSDRHGRDRQPDPGHCRPDQPAGAERDHRIGPGGRAGRGFAVVASEVKNLAGEAAKATDQITREIDGVQAITDDVASMLENIRSAVDTLFAQVAAAASAVEEQSVVTSGMSQSMHEVAGAVGDISSSITDIGAAVTQIDSAFKRTREGGDGSRPLTAQGVRRATQGPVRCAGPLGASRRRSASVSLVFGGVQVAD